MPILFGNSFSDFEFSSLEFGIFLLRISSLGFCISLLFSVFYLPDGATIMKGQLPIA